MSLPKSLTIITCHALLFRTLEKLNFSYLEITLINSFPNVQSFNIVEQFIKQLSFEYIKINFFN